MKAGLSIVILLALSGLLCWLRVLPFREKKTSAPERTARAELTARRVTSGANRTGRSSGMGYNYVLTFRLEEGQELELYSHDCEYGALREGMTGKLTWKEPYFVSFEEDAP